MAYSNLAQLAMLAEGTDEAVAWGGRAIALAEQLARPRSSSTPSTTSAPPSWADAGRPGGHAGAEPGPGPGQRPGGARRPGLHQPGLDRPQAARLRARRPLPRPGDRLLRRARPGHLGAGHAGRRRPGPTSTRALDRGHPHRRGRPPRPPDGPRPAGSTRWSSSAWSGPPGRPGGVAPLDEALALAGTGEPGELQRLGPVAAARAEAAWLEGDPAAARAGVDAALDLASGPGATLAGRRARLLAAAPGGPTGSRPAGSRTARPSRSRCRWPATGTPRPSAGGRSAAPTRPPRPRRQRPGGPAAQALAELQRLGRRPWPPRSPAGCASWASGVWPRGPVRHPRQPGQPDGPASWRSWPWLPRACATRTSPSASSSPPRPSTTTSPPSWPSSASGHGARLPWPPTDSASSRPATRPAHPGAKQAGGFVRNPGGGGPGDEIASWAVGACHYKA